MYEIILLKGMHTHLNYISVTGIPCLKSSIEGHNGPSVHLLPCNKSPVLLAVHRR